LLLATLFSVIGLIACSGESKLEDVRWVLQSYGAPDSLTAVLTDTEVTAQFHSDGDRISGSRGCNTYSGSYEVSNGNQLRIPDGLTATKRACEPPIMVQEQQYFEILEAATGFEIEDDTLIIDSGQRVLVFRISQSDLPTR
jgi:heat shock protein HslJ